MVSVELALVIFFIGMLSSFSPCLFPLLPSYVAYTLHSGESQLKTFFSSLMLVLGVIVVFFSLGLVSQVIGSFLLENYGLFARIQGTLLVLAGIIMIRTPGFIYKIALPAKLQTWLFDCEENCRPFLVSFILGLVFTIIAAPCAAGYFLFVWSILLNKTIASQFILVLVYSLGVGMPFILMSIFVPQYRSDFVSKVHKTNKWVSKIMGIILIIVGIALLNEITTFNILLG